MRLYEELEAWSALVLCYRLLDKRPACEAIILRRLEVPGREEWGSRGRGCRV